MKTVLHLRTKNQDPLAEEIISKERQSGTQVDVMDLTGAEPDYKLILEKIFASDSIHVW